MYAGGIVSIFAANRMLARIKIPTRMRTTIYELERGVG
jgi:hypothetical protein